MRPDLEQFRQVQFEEELKPRGIKLGVPMLFPNEIRSGEMKVHHVAVPNNPHVFFCRELDLRQGNQPYETVSDVMVMFGHGIAKGPDGEDWVFLGTGEPVEQAAMAYQDAAQQFDYPALDALVVCRDDAVYREGLQLSTPFRRGVKPLIYPTSTVTLRELTDSHLIPGDGVNKLIADADSWKWVDQWDYYWGVYSGKREDREIPAWATQPIV